MSHKERNHPVEADVLAPASTGLQAKWCAFWYTLDDREKFYILQMLGYGGGYPGHGVSPLLVARLLQLALKNNLSQER